MSIRKVYTLLNQFLLLLLFILLISTNTLTIYVVLSSATVFFLIGNVWLSKNKFKLKFFLTIALLFMMIGQQVFNVLFIFSGVQDGGLFIFKKIIGIIIMVIPFLAFYINNLYKIQYQFSHSIKDMTVISFEMLKEIHQQGLSFKNKVKQSRNALSRKNLSVILQDLPRHSYTQYINKNNLTDSYFQECYKSLTDEHLYIVFSNTGSPASEIISCFTNKMYNHVSISFDRDLKTIISYNGGENVSPPGLNQEQLEFFNKKSDASILVYKIQAPREKKQLVIEKVKEINKTGSAYNIVGLLTSLSFRPNIMFCSQFVYNILKIAELEYFDSSAAKVRPTDLIENDYHRKLQFCYEIKFNEL